MKSKAMNFTVTEYSRWTCIRKQDSHKNCLILEVFSSAYTHVNFNLFGFKLKKRKLTHK